jgi:hypothetical protein
MKTVDFSVSVVTIAFSVLGMASNSAAISSIHSFFTSIRFYYVYRSTLILRHSACSQSFKICGITSSLLDIKLKRISDAISFYHTSKLHRRSFVIALASFLVSLFMLVRPPTWMPMAINLSFL